MSHSSSMRWVIDDYNIINDNNRRNVNDYARAICELVEVISNKVNLPMNEAFIWNYNKNGVTDITLNGELVYEARTPGDSRG